MLAKLLDTGYAPRTVCLIIYIELETSVGKLIALKVIEYVPKMFLNWTSQLLQIRYNQSITGEKA